MRYIRIFYIFLGAIFAIQFAPGAFAQENEAPVPTITRLVKVFSSLEAEWMEAVRKRDVASLDRILADDFEMRSGPEPGRPTARADWIKQSFRETPFSSSIEQMAVHDFGNVALVSFLWKLDAPKSSGFAKQLFVVDTWELEGGSWRAKVRYIAPTGEAALLIPGVAQGSEVIEKKY
jgi:ketosteroid isomerase-like protein